MSNDVNRFKSESALGPPLDLSGPQNKAKQEVIFLYKICKSCSVKSEKRHVSGDWGWSRWHRPVPVCFSGGSCEREAGVKGPVVVCDRGGISSWRVFCAPLAVSKVVCPGC